MTTFISGALSWFNHWLHRKDRARMAEVHRATYGDKVPTVMYGNVPLNPDTHTGDDARPPYNAEAVRQALNPDEYP
jgi:hypothetical protein